MKIGLTGGIGTGKSTVGRKLKEKGYAVIDLDVISREVIKNPEIIDRLVREFGDGILSEKKDVYFEREISRNKLGQIVFKDEKKVSILNSIMHPEIIKKMHEEMERLLKDHKVVIVEVQLLFEINLEREFDFTVLVYSSKEVQLKRVTGRDKRTEEQVRDIINSQMDMEVKRKKSDYIIENDGDMEALDTEVEKFVERLKSFEEQL